MKTLVALSKRMSAREQNTLREALEQHRKTHTGQRGEANIRMRDIQVQLLSGRLWWLETQDGTKIFSAAARDEISQTLDWSEPRVGAMLTRNAEAWRPTYACKAGAKLTMTPSVAFPGCCPPATADYLPPPEPEEGEEIPPPPQPAPLEFDWWASWWADGPRMKAEEHEDGGQVFFWPDETGNGRNLVTEDVNSPCEFRTSAPGGKSEVFRGGSNNHMVNEAAWDLPQPLTIVGVLSLPLTTHSNGAMAWDGRAAEGRIALYHQRLSDEIRLNAGQNASIENQKSGYAVYVAHYAGENSYLERDGLPILAGEAGDNPLTGIRSFVHNNGGQWFGGPWAWVAVIDRDLTAGEKDYILDWTTSEYGLPA